MVQIIPKVILAFPSTISRKTKSIYVEAEVTKTNNVQVKSDFMFISQTAQTKISMKKFQRSFNPNSNFTIKSFLNVMHFSETQSKVYEAVVINQ